MATYSENIEVLWEGIYEGTANVFNMSTTGLFLYDYTFKELDAALTQVFGRLDPLDQVAEWEKAVNFRQNIGRFSGCKTFQEFQTLTENVFLPDGTKRPFKEFKEIAKSVSDTYNSSWLKVEQDMVFQQSQNARAWITFEQDAEFLPLLMYQTIGDDRVRDSHRELDKIVRPVKDPIWDRIAPANGWRCRCELIQLEDDQRLTTTNTSLSKKTRLIDKDFKKDAEWAKNPGKVDYVFKEKGKDKHPYFSVPRVFNDMKENNFGFDIPVTYNGN